MLASEYEIEKYDDSTKHAMMLALLLERLRESDDADRVEEYLYSPNQYMNHYLVSKTYSVFLCKDGFILGKHVYNDTYELLMLYIAPKARRMGLALKLKKTLADYAKSRGYKRIVSCVKSDHYASIQLNKKARWKQARDKIWSDDYIWFTKKLS